MIFSEKATIDTRLIRQWYSEQRQGLGNEFFAEVLLFLNKVEKNPASFRHIKKDVRCCRLKKFPYYIYFSYLNGITVLRVRHIKQQQLNRFT